MAMNPVINSLKEEEKNQSVCISSPVFTLFLVCGETQWPSCGEFDICLQSFRHKKVLLIKGAPGEGTVLRQQWVGFSGLGLIPLSTLGVGG